MRRRARGSARARRAIVNAEARAIRAALEQHEAIEDATFDLIYPAEVRDRSAVHWTPVGVAIRATCMLRSAPGQRFLDVGAGVGKACLVGTLATDSEWWGVEQDPSLVQVAKRAARFLGIEPRFVEGYATSVDWNQFDGFYLFNPFSSLMLGEHASPFVRYATITKHVRHAIERLASARLGTRVVTYHGFGGDMPGTYDLVLSEPIESDRLQLWVRSR